MFRIAKTALRFSVSPDAVRLRKAVAAGGIPARGAPHPRKGISSPFPIPDGQPQRVQTASPPSAVSLKAGDMLRPV